MDSSRDAALQQSSSPASFPRSRSLSCKAPPQEREEEQRCVTRIDLLLATPPNGELARR